MKRKPERRSSELVWILLVICLASGLILPNLGNRYLWQDEAQTALIARTVLSHGVPLMYDGRNSFSQEFGNDCDSNYVVKFPGWLEFYILAPFLALLGSTTLAARLPFALFGVATAVLVYLMARRLWGSRRSAVLAALCLILSVPFLVLARQCRYYSIDAFFVLLGLFGYMDMLQGKRRGIYILGLCLILVFHSHYYHYAALVATVLTHSLIFHRKKLGVAALLVVGSIAVNLWWMLRMADVAGVARYNLHFDVARTFEFAWYYVSQIGKHIFHPALLAVPVLLVAEAWIRKRRMPRPHAETLQGLALLALFAVFSIVFLTILAPFAFFRYLAPLIPIMCVILGLILDSGMKRYAVVGLAALAFFIYLQPLSDYLYELTHDYDGPMEGIVNYLNRNGSPDDLVLISYEDMPVTFYTKMRVIGGLTGEELSIGREPDWVILRRDILDTARPVYDYVQSNINIRNYRRIVLDAPDIMWENRENPEDHIYRTVLDAPPVVVYRRAR